VYDVRYRQFGIAVTTGSARQRHVLFKRPIWVVAALVLLAVVAPAIGSPAAESGPPDVPVITPQRLAFHVVAGRPNPPPQPLSITSSGDPLLWTTAFEATWLALDVIRGTTPAEIGLRVDATGLTVGHYKTTVTLEPDAVVPVTLDVYAPTQAPEIVIEPVALTFSAVAGGPTPELQELAVLALSEATDGAWSAVTSAPWLRLSAYSGTAPATLSVSIDHSALPAGDYAGAIWIGDQTVDVALSVTEPASIAYAPQPPPTATPERQDEPAAMAPTVPAPSMSIDPPALSFAAVQSGAAPERKDLTLASSDGSALPWVATVDVPWVLLSTTSGTLPETIKVEVTANQLGPGEHVATITVNGEALALNVRVLPTVESNPAFLTLAARHDEPVRTTQVGRTWLWGPQPLGTVSEPYVEGPNGQRVVQYYDKARMEITHPEADAASDWYVTNGRLAWELITGKVQTGDAQFITGAAAEIPVAGDADDTLGPTYFAFTELLAAEPAPTGSAVTQTISRHGHIGADEELAAHGVTIGHVERATDHAIASIFWDYLQSRGQVWDGGTLVEGQLFEPWHFVTGLPITEPYWARVKVGGSVQDVLIQCFERRCLTYTPGNTPEWRVEQGNVGLHYFRWRYE
jgi:hypothetical protein